MRFYSGLLSSLFVLVCGQYNESDYVRVFEGHFVEGSTCQPIQFLGFTSTGFLEVASQSPEFELINPPGEIQGESPYELIDSMIKFASDSGFNLLKLRTFTDSQDITFNFGSCYGAGMVHIDYLLDTLARYDMYAMVSLSTFTTSPDQNYPGSSWYFLNQVSLNQSSDFIMNEDAIQQYAQHVQCMLERVNTVNNKRYADDSTIMGWMLSEGISCDGDQECVQQGAIGKWADRFGSFIRQLDPYHLITIGEDGFYNDYCSNINTMGVNPDPWYPWYTGHNSPIDHASAYIDFISFSFTPDSWVKEDQYVVNQCETKKKQFEFGWFDAKIKEAEQLGKPLLLHSASPSLEEDFVTKLSSFWGSVFDIVEENLMGSGVLGGSNVGNIDFGYNTSQAETWIDPLGLEMALILNHSALIQAFNDDMLVNQYNCSTDDYPIVSPDDFSAFTCPILDVIDESRYECTLDAIEQLVQTGIIEVNNGTLEDEKCQPYYFMGLTTFQIEDMMSSGRLQELLVTLKNAGITVLRFVAPIGAENEVEVDEEKAQKLDDLLNRLAFLNMKAILLFAYNDNPPTFNSTDELGNEAYLANTVMWFVNDVNIKTNRTVPYGHDDFFVKSSVKNLFQDYIIEVVNRTNTVNGRQYASDPTILAWNLVDDARCLTRVDKCLVNLNYGKWIQESTSVIKQVDDQHLVSPGSSGFYRNPCWRFANPGQWAASRGPDAIFDDAITTVDYVGFDYMPDEWEKNQDLNFTQSWLAIKESQGVELNKPLILHKFGKIVETESELDVNMTEINLTNYREDFIDPVYARLLESFVQNLETGQQLQGMFFTDWDWNYDGDEGVSYSVPAESSTWDLILNVTSILKTYYAINDSAPITQECKVWRNRTEKVVRVARQSTPQTCCDNNCGAMFGYLVGENYYNAGEKTSAQQCCDACQEDEDCEGWTWCSCVGGCSLPNLKLSFANRVCLLKKFPSPKFAMNLTDGAYGSWLSGIVLSNLTLSAKLNDEGEYVRDFSYHSECQVGGPCGTDIQECSDRQIENNLICPSQNCNAEQVFYDTDVVNTIDLNSEIPAVPITTVDQCCQACQLHQMCNVFTFCNNPYGCGTGCPGQFDEDFGPYRQCQGGKWSSWQCSLKYYNGTGKPNLVEVGELQPWISGFLSWKNITIAE